MNRPPLPDPLMCAGHPVDAELWWKSRRGEILQLYETHVFGKTPRKEIPIRFESKTVDQVEFGGGAIRKEMVIHLSGDPDGPKMNLLMYLPRQRPGRCPVFVGLNFCGNHTIHSDEKIRLVDTWIINVPKAGILGHKPLESHRGKRADFWPVEKILSRGYGLLTCCCGDLDPDFDDGFQNGIHPLFYRKGQSRPDSDEWGSIGAWAWGLSRMMDYLETDPDVDPSKVAVMGHSRLGKAALWAGAQDKRFAVVIANNSGCGGAALFRGKKGEMIKNINDQFPHWFSDRFKQYHDRETELPLDQHMLISLIAPRPVYIASAEEDLWADPVSEFLGARHADPVYRMLGVDGIGVSEMPGLAQPILSRIGYHIRPGQHAVTPYDWNCWMDFADNYLILL